MGYKEYDLKTEKLWKVTGKQSFSLKVLSGAKVPPLLILVKATRGLDPPSKKLEGPRALIVKKK